MAQNASTLKVTTRGDRELVITRALAAPRTLVWDAMTKPELIRRWLFCPPGWEMTECEGEPRVGGSFRWAWSMNGATAMSMSGVFKEVRAPDRMVRTERFDTGCVPQAGEQLVTMTLVEERGRTTLTLEILFPSKEARDGMVASGMEQGMAAGYNQLDAMLAATQGSGV